MSRKFRITRRKLIHWTFVYGCLTLLAVATVIPFLWTLSTSLKGQNEAIFSMPPQFIPENLTFENYKTVWTSLPIPRYFVNSIILSFFGVTLPLIFSSMAAFPLARMEFKGKHVIFMGIIATMMIPGEVTMIPIYLTLDRLGLIGNIAGVILPGAVSAFGIFLMRQAFIAIPKEIEDIRTKKALNARTLLKEFNQRIESNEPIAAVQNICRSFYVNRFLKQHIESFETFKKIFFPDENN